MKLLLQLSLLLVILMVQMVPPLLLVSMRLLKGRLVLTANATKLVFTTGVSETAASSATAKATLSSIGDFTVAGDLIIKDGGLIGSASDVDAIAIASNGVVTLVNHQYFLTGN